MYAFIILIGITAHTRSTHTTELTEIKLYGLISNRIQRSVSCADNHCGVHDTVIDRLSSEDCVNLFTVFGFVALFNGFTKHRFHLVCKHAFRGYSIKLVRPDPAFVAQLYVTA